MITAQTRLRKIPDKCLKCRFCINDGVSQKTCKEVNYISKSYVKKKCYLTGIEVPYIYNKEKRNWEYLKCQSCPLGDE